MEMENRLWDICFDTAQSQIERRIHEFVLRFYGDHFSLPPGLTFSQIGIYVHNNSRSCSHLLPIYRKISELGPPNFNKLFFYFSNLCRCNFFGGGGFEKKSHVLLYGVIRDLIRIPVVWAKLDVAFHSSRSERVKGKGWVAPYKFLKSDGTKAHIGNETQTYGAI